LFDATGLSRQDHEGGLKSVFGRMPIIQHALAGTKNQRPIPPNDGGEGNFVTVGRIPFEQLRNRQIHCDMSCSEVANTSDDWARFCGRHLTSSSSLTLPITAAKLASLFIILGDF
jgi:hypothetical protein